MSSDGYGDGGDGDTTATVFFSTPTSTSNTGDNLGNINNNSNTSSIGNDVSTAYMTKMSCIIPSSSNISLQQSNWLGAIPIVLTLAPTSLSSPMAPRPIHAMISRCNYLHVALMNEVMTLANYAPVSVGSSSAVVARHYAKVGGATATVVQMRAEEPPDDDDCNHDENSTKMMKKKKDGGGNGSSDDLNNDNEAAAANTESNGYPHNHNNKNNNNNRSIYHDVLPECWFEDVVTGIPLRWQLFAGILYDLVRGKSSVLHTGNNNNTVRQQRQDLLHRNNMMENSHYLPWQVRVHFTCYPHEKILALDDGGGGVGGCSVQYHHQQQQQQQQQSNSDGDGINDMILNSNNAHRRIDKLIFRTYRNALKQALFLQYGTSRTAMSINKQSHEQLWDAIQTCNYEKYCEVNSTLQRGLECRPFSTVGGGTKKDAVDGDEDLPQLIPVRLMLNDLPVIQRPIRHQRRKDDNNIMDSNDDACNKRKSTLEERVEAFQLPSYTTLGDFLSNYFPGHFEIGPKGVTTKKSAEDDGTYFYYCIHGIQPSLNCAMVDLWRCLSHPDNFLYVIVVTE